MSFARAITRITPMIAIVIAGGVVTYPAETSWMMSTGVFNLIHETGSDMAIPVLNSAIALDSKNSHAYRALAYQYEQDDNFELQLDALNRGLKVAPEDPDLLNSRAEAYLTDGQYQKAIGDFEKKADQSIRAHIGLGEAYLGAGELDKAYRTFTNAISDSGHSFESLASAYSGRGLASFAQGKYKAAIDDLSMAIEEGDYSDKPLNYIRRGLANQALAQRTAARHDFETAYRDYGGGDSGEAALAKAFCFIQRGDKPSADEAMSKATEEGLSKEDLKGIIFPNLPSVKFDW